MAPKKFVSITQFGLHGRQCDGPIFEQPDAVSKTSRL
jgi:hypothetical protein